MKVLVQAMFVTGFVGAIAGAAAAQTDDMDPAAMTCANFMALSQEEKTAAMDEMAADQMAPDAMVADEAATDEMAPDDMAAGAMTSEQMTAMMAACEGSSDMMAMDAMTSAMKN